MSGVLGPGEAPSTLGHHSLPDSATDIPAHNPESLSAAGSKEAGEMFK